MGGRVRAVSVSGMAELVLETDLVTDVSVWKQSPRRLGRSRAGLPASTGQIAALPPETPEHFQTPPKPA